MNIDKIISHEIESEKCFRDICRKEISHSPLGRLDARLVNGHPYYYQHTRGNTPRYLSVKTDTGRIEALKSKRYFQEALKVFDNNIPVLERALPKLKSYLPDDLMKAMPSGMVSLPDNCYKLFGSINARRWEKTPYPHYSKYAHNLKQRTAKGHFVRSKSELDICNTLFYYGVPYLYEPTLTLRGDEFHPDILAYSWYFQRLFYWEHSGMTFDKNYLEFNDQKFEIYRECGIVPWRNLIITYDDERGHLDSRIIDNLVRLWFVGQ